MRRSGLSEEREYHFSDLSLLFSERREALFIDWCHVGEAGNEAIAKRMTEDILRLRRVSSGPP
jgi:hypothetical protein